MALSENLNSQHGVMLNYQGKGILIIGEAGIGKSSLALELIHHGASLIADDVVDFAIEADQLVAHCPKVLSGLLHSRELGLMDIRKVCGENSWRASTTADLCIELKQIYHPEPSVSTPIHYKFILGKALVVLTLSIDNPASLITRVNSWLAMQHYHADSQNNQHKMLLWQFDKMAF